MAEPVVVAYPFISTDLAGAATYTGCSVREIQRAIELGDLVAHYIGEKATKPVFRPRDLDEWIKSRPTESGRKKTA